MIEFASDAFCVFIKCSGSDDDSYSISSDGEDDSSSSPPSCLCEQCELIRCIAIRTHYILCFISQNSVNLISYGVNQSFLELLCSKLDMGVSLIVRIEQVINKLLVASTLRDLLLIQLGGRTGFVSRSIYGMTK